MTTGDTTGSATVAATGASNLLELQEQVCFALAIASRSVNAVYRPILEPYGLTHPQYLVMLALWEQSPRSVKNLGAALQLEPATLSPLLKRLEVAGLVIRQRSSLDERMLDISLTPAGVALRAEAESIPPRIIDQLGMSHDELAALRGSLWRVIGAAQAVDADAGNASASGLQNAQPR